MQSFKSGTPKTLQEAIKNGVAHYKYDKEAHDWLDENLSKKELDQYIHEHVTDFMAQKFSVFSYKESASLSSLASMWEQLSDKPWPTNGRTR